MTLNRVVSTPDDYSTVGVSKFKLSTFAIGTDGETTIKSSVDSGDVDAKPRWTERAYYLILTIALDNFLSQEVVRI